MKLNSQIKQINQNEIADINYDLFFISSGYEERATFLIDSCNIRSERKEALSFENYSDIKQRIVNDKKVIAKGFNIAKSAGDNDITINKILRSLDFESKSEFNILVDYSSMTRVWYSAILNHFRWLETEKEVKVNIYFSYSLAIFNPPPDLEVPNKHIGPIKGFYTISLPLKPTALIIGLGYERIRAYGLTEFLDAETKVFRTDSTHEKFTLEVENKNEELLRMISDDNIFSYSLEKIEHLHFVLNSLCAKLIEKYRIVIAPCGPKPFTLISLLNSILLRDLDIWRISPGIEGIPQNRKPDGSIVVTKITFESK